MSSSSRSSRKFGCVFVATDFSPGGARAVARAATLPLERGGRLVLLHALPEGLAAADLRLAEAHARRKLQGAAKRAMQVARACGNGPVAPAFEVRRGEAAATIVRGARLACADLVVLGRHSRRPVRDLFLGSTAHRVVRTAGLPVLLVNSEASKPYRRPIAALDLGDTSTATVDLVQRVLRERPEPLGLVYAYEVPFEGLRFPGLDPDDLTRWGRKFETQAKARVAEFLAATGLDLVATVRPGPAAAAIVREANRRKADLLAIGTHGRRGLDHLLLGSVAERVLAFASCDVLVARPVHVSHELPLVEPARAR